jgi:ABC-2 type transport system permease protein
MITRIARKEITDLYRDGRLRLLAAVMLALAGAGLALGVKHYRATQSERERAQAAERATWEKQGVKNPHSAAHFGVYAFKPQLPLGALDCGVEPFTGVAVWLEAHKQNEFRFKPAQDANSLARFGQLMVAAVLQLLAPLLIVLTAFGAFAAEREQGTLRQLLALGVEAGKLAMGKTLGVVLGLGAVLAPAAVAGAAALLLLSDASVVAASAGRAGLLAASYLLYFGALIGVTLAVSAVAPSSRSALVALLGIWIFNCLAAPKAAADLARRLAPTPSAFEFAGAIERDMKEGIDGHAPQEQRMAQLKAGLLRKYQVNDVRQLPVNLTGVILDEGEKYGNRVFDKHYGALWAAFERQNRIHQLGGLVAPLLAIRAVSMAVAGTDFRQHRHFAEAAEQYRREFIGILNQDIIENGNSAGGGAYVRGEELWRKIPPFRYEAPGLGWVISGQWMALGTLVLWCAGGLALALGAAWRMKVD